MARRGQHLAGELAGRVPFLGERHRAGQVTAGLTARLVIAEPERVARGFEQHRLPGVVVAPALLRHRRA